MSDTRTLKVQILGDATSGQRALQDVAGEGEKTAGLLASSFGHFFSTVGALGGGALGPLGEAFSVLGDQVEQLDKKHVSLTEKMAITGTVATGVGGILTAAASREKQAQDQLKQAISDTGNSYSDYGDEIEKTIKHQEGFGHSAADTIDALQQMTQATGDPTKALDMMGLAANLAAARHESLTDAANQLDQVVGGKGQRTLAAFGITHQDVAAAAGQNETATDLLAKKIDGQASASTDNWGSKLEILKTKIEDNAAQLGEKYGPAITAVGAGLTGASAAAELASSILGRLRGASEAATVATEAQTVAQGGLDAAYTEGAVAEGIALGPILLIIAAVAAVGLGIYELATHWSTVMDAMKSAALDAWHFIDSNFVHPIEGFFTAIGSVVSSAGHAISSGASGMFDGIKEAFKAAINFVIRGWDSLHFTMPSVDTHIPGIGSIGGFTIGLPQIPVLDTGGIVMGPTLAALSVNSVPEAVIPLPQLQQLMGGHGEVHKHYHLGGVTSNTPVMSLPDAFAGMERMSLPL